MSVFIKYDSPWDHREVSGDTLYSMWLSNHCAVYLKPIQNNIDCKLYLKMFKIKEKSELRKKV